MNGRQRTQFTGPDIWQTLWSANGTQAVMEALLNCQEKLIE